MVLARGFLGLVLLGVWIFCIIDAITTPPEKVRHLPKAVWVILVIVLIDIGSIIWLVAGRERGSRPATAGVAGNRIHPMPSNPDDDAEFMRLVRQRAEEQRRRAGETDPPPDRPAPPDPS